MVTVTTGVATVEAPTEAAPISAALAAIGVVASVLLLAGQKVHLAVVAAVGAEVAAFAFLLNLIERAPQEAVAAVAAHFQQLQRVHPSTLQTLDAGAHVPSTALLSRPSEQA